MTEPVVFALVFCTSFFAALNCISRQEYVGVAFFAVISGIYLGLLIKSSIKYAEQIKG